MNDQVDNKNLRGWDFFWDSLSKQPILGFLFTSWLFIRNPSKFSDEVLKEDWNQKTNPISFALQAFFIEYALMVFVPFADIGANNWTVVQNQVDHIVMIICLALAILPAALAVHLIMGKSRPIRSWVRPKFIDSLFMFCYLGGISQMFFEVFNLTEWLRRMIRVESWRFYFFLLEGVIVLAMTFYFYFPIYQMYKPKGLRFIAGAIVSGVIYFEFVNYAELLTRKLFFPIIVEKL
jgi:hypothetical protein